ncbi:MAG: hypothetical protein KIT84_02635 [Labilithrix sp.]|nr:hypothetical protein [Labilithrix sp.]MCW5809877.1 hypothetical protein [Labilithrix sp.]
MMMRAVLCFAAAAVVACGGKESKTPDDVSTDPPEASPVAPPAPASSPSPEATPAVPKKRKAYEIVNLCPNVVTLLFDKGGSEDPKAATVGSRTLAGNGRIDDPPRDNDGNQVIWLMVRDAPLVRVRVSRGTTRVEVGTSCDTLEMH